MTPRTPTLEVERALLAALPGTSRTLVALDEVGRGALAGPVSVGAVLVDAAVREAPAGLRDSKLLSAAARERLFEPVSHWPLSWAVGHASPGEIDEFGIVAALRLAAHRAIRDVDGEIGAVLLDGNVDYVSGPAPDRAGSDVIPHCLPVVTRVKADRDCAAVAAASVLAKVTRDRIMTDLSADFPDYAWAANKGYGTAAHAAALARVGACTWHRRTWTLPGLPPVDVGSRPVRSGG